jgi:superfamily I DNA and/or RNA helicase
LEDLLDIGIPKENMVRLGGKWTAKTKPLSLFEEAGCKGGGPDRESWRRISRLKKDASCFGESLKQLVDGFWAQPIGKHEIMEHLEFLRDGKPFFDAFSVPDGEKDFIRVGRDGKRIGKYYLLERWADGQDPGFFKEHISGDDELREIWGMIPSERANDLLSWFLDISKDKLSAICSVAAKFDECQQEIEQIFGEKYSRIIKTKRIVGCTTTAAAKYVKEIQAASADVVLVEEAGEILESHVLTSLGSTTDQLILIGDHKQLRPKVANYKLTVEKGEGFDLNRSMFERLVLKGFPHERLTQQHRMRPEISKLVRHLTYPDLIDGPNTQGRPNIRGLQDNVVFVSHDHLEDENSALAKQRNMNLALSSKRNKYEAEMVLQYVKYLGMQGYGTKDITVLTPYLGQIQVLRDVLSETNDPILNDLDSHDLLSAGLISPANAKLNKKPIRLSSIGKISPTISIHYLSALEHF